MKARYSFSLCLVIFLLLHSCDRLPFRTDPLDGPFPYRFTKVHDFWSNSLLVDLDKDGQQEGILIDYGLPATPFSPTSIKIHNDRFDLIEEIPFNGIIKRVFVFDWDDDGIDDIAVPYSYRNAVYFKILNWQGEIIKDATELYSGRPRVDSTGTHLWEGIVKQIYFEDINQDGKKELVVFPNEGRAQKPRGVFVYEGKSLRLLFKHEVAPYLKNSLTLFDVNDDGYLEILIPTGATCNGNKVDDTDDAHSYLFLIDHNGEEIWRRPYGGKYTGVECKVIDVDGDGEDEIAAFYYDWKKQETQPRIEILNPQTGQPEKSFALPIQYAFWDVVQTDQKTDQEFVVVDHRGKALILNSNLEIVKERDLTVTISTVATCPDLDNDGFSEIIVQHSTGTLWMDHNLSLKTDTSFSPSNVFGDFHIYNRQDAPPLLAMFEEDTAVLAALEKNNRYLLDYYGPSLAYLLASVFVIGLVRAAVKTHRRTALYSKAADLLAFRARAAILLLDHKLRIIFCNAAGREMFTLASVRRPLSVHKLPVVNNPFVEALLDLENGDAIHYEKTIASSDATQRFRLIAEPIPLNNSARPHWLVSFVDDLVESQLEEAKTWSAMAQRIAHDIKNPLTSILLTLQRLQMEYRDRDGETAKTYDLYTDRIVERIESLRKMSRGFMKFLNLEKINPQPTNVSAFIEALLSTSLIELPKDVQLDNKLASDLPATHLDQEQLQTVLENLVSNAINAMPDGGKLFLRTSLASDLQFNDKQQRPTDYITIEVMDTGCGISPEIRDKLFQPFISKTALGTGLGLTIVKKIVDDHQGHIEVSTEAGVGSSFLVYLPVA